MSNGQVSLPTTRPKSKSEKRREKKQKRDLELYLQKLTPEERVAYDLQQIAYKKKLEERAAKKLRWKQMTAEERAAYRLQHPRSKAQYDIPEPDPNGANECIKCGFRTDRDWCPDCGRPCY